PSPAAVRRQPAEGDDRSLARLRVPDAPLLRPDARDRCRHEASGLRPAAPARRRGRRRAVLLERADGIPLRLRPGCLALRRTDHGRDPRSGGRRGDAAPLDARSRRHDRAGCVTSATATVGRERARRSARRVLSRHGWTIAVYGLLLVMLLYWRSLSKHWGTFDVQSLSTDALPLAFAAM